MENETRHFKVIVQNIENVTMLIFLSKTTGLICGAITNVGDMHFEKGLSDMDHEEMREFAKEKGILK